MADEIMNRFEKSKLSRTGFKVGQVSQIYCIYTLNFCETTPIASLQVLPTIQSYNTIEHTLSCHSLLP